MDKIQLASLALHSHVYLCLSKMAASAMAPHAEAQPIILMALGSVLVKLAHFASSAPVVTHNPWLKEKGTACSIKALEE